jgi:O-antigen ligase
VTAVIAILTALLAGTPLALWAGIFLSHDVIPKAVLILIGAAVLLFLLPQWSRGLGILWGRTDGRIFLCLVAAEGVSLLVSTLFSTQPMLSFAGTVWRRLGTVEQLATLVIAAATASVAALRPEWTRILFRAMAVCGGIAAGYGVLQYFGVDPFLPRELYTIDYLGGIVRPPATMGHAIYFSAYLVPVVLIAAACSLKETTSLWKGIHAIVAVLGCVAIILSGTRASLLAVAAGGVVFVFSIRRRTALKVAAGAGAVLAIAGVITLTPAGKDFRHRLQQWREDLGGPRAGVWRDSLSLVGARPVVGSGPETFAVEFRKVESKSLSRAYPDFYHETPHNAFLDTAFAQGIPGILILAGLFAVGCRRRSDLRAPLTGMFVGSFFASMTLVTQMYLWSVAGLAVALSIEGVKPAKEREDKARVWAVPASLAGGVFIVAAFLLAAADLAYFKLRAAVENKDFAGASEDWSSAVFYSLGMPGYELWSSRELATLARSLGNSPESANAWVKAGDAANLAAKQGEERFSAEYQAAILRVAAGDVSGAEARTRETIAMAPNWYKPHLLLAQILQATGRNDEAAREAQIAADLGWKRK